MSGGGGDERTQQGERGGKSGGICGKGGGAVGVLMSVSLSVD